jgi:MoxR-like ATPase
MEDFRIDIIIDQGPNARSVQLTIPRFTLVGATTRSGLLSAPLLTRFGIRERLDYYTAAELTEIVKRSARIAAGPQKRVKKQSARDAWFDKVEDELAMIWDEALARLSVLAECREESKRSFDCFAQVMADELAPGIVKIVDDDDSEEDPCEDVPDDEVTDEGDGEEEEETEESEEFDSDVLESDETSEPSTELSEDEEDEE